MDKQKKTRRLVGDLPDMVPGVSLGITMRNLLPEEYEANEKLDPMVQYPVVNGFVSGEPCKEPMRFLEPIDIKLSPEMELFLKRMKDLQDEFFHALSSIKPYKNGE